MPPSLRKRISKRSPRKTEKKVTVSPSSSSPLLAALDHLHKPIAASNESLELVPPPLMLPREPDNVRCSPSKSLLQRYRGRNSMENAVPTTTRDAPVTRSRSRDSAFTEDFGDDRKRSRSPKSRSSSIKSTIRKVGGIDFEMLNAAHSPLKLPQRSKSAEPARARSPAESDDSSSDPLFHRRPTSRSQTREKERSDSTIGDADSDALTLGDVLALKAKGPSPGSESPRAQSPRHPSLLKKKNSDPAIAARPKIPRVTRSTAKNGKQNTSTQKGTVRPVGSDDEISTDSTSDDSSSDCTFTLDTTTGIVGRSPRKSNSGPQPTQVVPPVNVGDILPGLLWTSPLGGTSRPDSPWLWCKRWTCCRCAANTIVEQHVCANLKCGHRRCGKQCKVVRDKRVYAI